MSQKKPITPRLKSTLDDLDTALEQWDSLTNKPQGEQVPAESNLQRKAKSLLKELRDQIEDFESLGDDEPSQPEASN